MEMRSSFFLLLCFALNCYQGVYAENEHDIKRGMHPFMAFIYYSDPSVVDISGKRFVRSAILIRPNWLVTTAIGPSLMDPLNGFPKNTLLARAGAITIDSKFTLNEDEDEQEREIVQIVRPYKHSATQWWTTDISLMKTLLSFNMTSAVGVQILNLKQAKLMEAKACIILIYAKMYGNSTEDKSLMMLNVDLLPPSINNCGSHFTASTMACAADSDDNKNALYDPEFCQGNSGGPLICNNDVVGLQTYIGNNCKQPHLYQLLLPWDNFIVCGIEDKCQEEHCGAICDVIYKDPPKIEVRITPPVTRDTAQDIIAFLNVPSTTTINNTTTEFISKTTPTPTAATTTAAIATFSEFVTEGTLTINLSDVTTVKEAEFTTPETTTNTLNSIVSESVIPDLTEKLTVQDKVSHWHTSAPWPKVKADYETVSESSIMSLTKMRNWPKEKLTGAHKDDEEVSRQPEAEAEAIGGRESYKGGSKVRTGTVPASSPPSNKNLSTIQTMLFGFIVLLCL